MFQEKKIKSIFYAVLIRMFDLMASSIVLILLSPFLVLVCIGLKLSGEGKVFFLQKRIGKLGKTFTLYKFATMLKNSIALPGGEVTLRNDPRVLKLGKYLRLSKLNEVPQLLNVIKGDMSLVGPRPQTSSTFKLFDPEDQEKILSVKPGLSGIGSIIFRDEEYIFSLVDNPLEFDANIIMPYKGKLEAWYVRNKTLKLYFKLIFFTFQSLFHPKNGLSFDTFMDIPELPKELLQFKV